MRQGRQDWNWTGSQQATWTLVILATCCLISLARCQSVRPVLNSSDIFKWVDTISRDLSTFRSSTLGADAFEREFAANNITAETVGDTKAAQLLQTVAGRIQSFMWKREKQVEAIRVEAEINYERYTWRNITCSELSSQTYIRASAISKLDNISLSSTPATGLTGDICSQNATLDLTSDPRQFDVETNRNFTTSHVPLYIHDGSSDILNAANYTIQLEAVMRRNTDETVKWQLFCSREGLMRIYPGIRWFPQVTGAQQKGLTEDQFDCRIQNWFEIASSYPKDLIVVIDNSGSMKGSNAIMANLTLVELLDSLTANDYFNVIMALGTESTTFIRYVADVYNRTMVQATERNKVKMMELIKEDTIKPLGSRILPESGISDLGLALTEAFELLRMAKNSSTLTSGGVQAIAMIVDSASDDFKAVFQKYNADRQVRLFSYLTGQEATDARLVRDMACRNRGFFSQIPTLSNVRQSVLSYVPVVGRSNSITRERFFTWSDLHLNQIQVMDMSDRAKNTLFTTVAQVAYDRRNQTQGIGENIGVAGIDVAVAEFTRLAPTWELGTLAYIFVVTNNGYIILHPELKTSDVYYMSRDITEVESPADYIPQHNSPNYLLPLRTALVTRQRAAFEMGRLKYYSDNARVLNLQYRYLTWPLNSTSPTGNETRQTSLSLGLAMPWRSGQQHPQRVVYANTARTGSALNSAQLFDLRAGLNSATCQPVSVTLNVTSANALGATLTDYEFCDFSGALRTQFNINPTCALGPVLAASRARQIAMGCSADFLDRVYADALSTRTAETLWSAGLTNSPVGSPARSLGALGGLLFLWAGASGLARWYSDPSSIQGPIDPTFVNQRIRNSTRDPLYERTVAMAADDASLGVVLTPPTSNVVTSNAAANNTFPRAFPLYLTVPLRTTGMAVAGVAGAELDYAKLEDYFVRATNSCASGTTCVTCAQLNVRCYLLDTSGIVTVSEIRQDVGKAFDQVNCDAMQTLVKENLFYSLQFYDFQSVCYRSVTIGRSASTLFSPIRALMRLATLVLLEGFSILSNLSSALFGPILAEAQQPGRNRSILTNRLTTGCQSYTMLQANATTLAAGPRQLLNRTCRSSFSNFLTAACSSDLYVRRVDKTNLIFIALVVDTGCDCQGCSPIVGSQELSTPVNFSLQLLPRSNPPWTPLKLVLTDNATDCTSVATPSGLRAASRHLLWLTVGWYCLQLSALLAC